MVDRAALIQQLEPRVQPTGSQKETIRKALDKALSELLLALPFRAVLELAGSAKSDLVALIGMTDQKTCEKLSALWEPKRKLDAELKASVRKDVLALIEGKRPAYEPVAGSISEAQAGDRMAIIARVRSAAPVKDLKALAKKWDKHWKPAQDTRKTYEDRIVALIEGAGPTLPPLRK